MEDSLEDMVKDEVIETKDDREENLSTEETSRHFSVLKGKVEKEENGGGMIIERYDHWSGRSRKLIRGKSCVRGQWSQGLNFEKGSSSLTDTEKPHYCLIYSYQCEIIRKSE